MLDHGQMSPITPARVAADDISEPGDLSQSTGSNNPLSTMETTFADAHDTHSLGEISHSLHHDHTIPVDGAMPHPIASHPAVTPPSSISTGPSDISTHPRSTTSLPAPSQDQQVVPSTIPRILVNPSCSGYFLEPVRILSHSCSLYTGLIVYLCGFSRHIADGMDEAISRVRRAGRKDFMPE